MPEYFQRPENALLKAQEFLDVGKQQAALTVLGDVLRSKKHRTWQKVHEAIITKYLDLCVELRKSQQAKEGLYQYKNICQTVNPKSLEDAILHYLDEAEKRTKEARDLSQETALKMVKEVEDLDMIDSPEDMLLKAVTGEQTQDRTDRLLLTPWVKYLWESFRQVLDLLRNNCRVEKLYHQVARRAFTFCGRYDRRTEFRKLCDNLRNHVKLSEQRHTAQFSVNLSNPDTQSLHLATKICQLDAAAKIDLWQEAFKAVEDIHYLMSLSKRPPKPQDLANFFNKLSLVFLKADFILFHASARHRLFRLTKEMKKNPNRDDLTRMASRLLVATLAIPITTQKHGIGKILDMEQTLIEKHITLSKLLGLDRPPTRSSLLTDFMRYNLLEYVPRQLKDLYKWLEKDFHPLKMSERVSTSLQWIQEQTKEPELVQYIKPIQKVVICRVLQQVASLYQTIKIDRLLKLLPCSEFELEQIIVDASRNGQLQARIDHNKYCILFGTDLNASPLYVEDEFFETQRLQALPSERVSESFNKMTRSLMLAHQMMTKDQSKKKADAIRAELVAHYNKTKAKDHQRILKRKRIIEQRKEQMETMNMEKEMKEQRLVQEQEEAVKEAEKARITKEQQEREQRRKEQLEKEEKRRNATDRLEMFKKSEIGQKILKDIDVEALEKFNPEELMKKQVETLEKEKKEMQDRLKAQEKKIDYFERAKRLAEIPLLEEKRKVEDVKRRELWDKLEDERIENLQNEYKTAIDNKDRLSRLQGEMNAHLDMLYQERLKVYEEKMVVFNKDIEQVRAQRLMERKRQRKLERFRQRQQEKAEEAERIREEEMRIQQEREERERREAEEEKKRLYEERIHKIKEQEQKQREREEAIERKLEASRMQQSQQQSSWRSGQQQQEDRGAWRRSEPPAPARQADSGAYRPPALRTEGAYRPPHNRGFERRMDDGDRDAPSARYQPPHRRIERPAARAEPREAWASESRQPPPASRNTESSWRRRSPSPPPQQQRRRSPMGVRAPPPGRSDSPPMMNRREEPAGKQAPPSRSRWAAPREETSGGGGGWRDRAPPPSRQAPPSSTAGASAWRRRDDPPPQSDKYQPPAPYRPPRDRMARQPEQPPRKPAQQQEGGEDDGWTTVNRR